MTEPFRDGPRKAAVEARVHVLEQKEREHRAMGAASDLDLHQVMLDTAEHTVILTELKSNVAGLKTDVAELKSGMGRIEAMLVALLERGIEK